MTTAHMSLKDLVTNYYKQKGYNVTEAINLEGILGTNHTFDLLLQKGQEKRLVWFRDWNRTVGINMVIKMDKASVDVVMPNPIMISQQFSWHARAYAKRRGMELLTKADVIKRSH